MFYVSKYSWIRSILSIDGALTLTFTLFNNIYAINTSRPRQNGRHFPDDIFKWFILNENIWISIDISLKFVATGRINNIPALVQIMAWRREGDKPLSEPMILSLLTQMFVARHQWVENKMDKASTNIHLVSTKCVILMTWYIFDFRSVAFHHSLKIFQIDWYNLDFPVELILPVQRVYTRAPFY